MTGIPGNETIWMQRKTMDGKTYYVTSKITRDTYYLYEVIDGVAKKIAKGPDPLTLEQKYVKENVEWKSED